jgi:uncharacterized damage-inducible protein DinB
MTYYGPKDLADSFRTVRKNTLIIAEEIPQEKYSFTAAPETRSVAQMLTHMAMVPRFHYKLHALERRTSMEGFDFRALLQEAMAEEQKPRSKAQILDMLREGGEQWAGWLEGLSEDFLRERVSMPAGTAVATKSRFELLLSVKEHEMHHRAQLMLIQRMLGLVPHLTRQMQARLAETTPAAATT